MDKDSNPFLNGTESSELVDDLQNNKVSAHRTTADQKQVSQALLDPTNGASQGRSRQHDPSYAISNAQTVMDLFVNDDALDSDSDSIEDILMDIECWSSSDEETEENTMIRDINRLMQPSGCDSMFD